MKKFKRIFAVFFCLLLASGILGGCGKAGSSSISAPSASQSGSKPLKIVTLDNHEGKIDIKKLQMSISQLEKGHDYLPGI